MLGSGDRMRDCELLNFLNGAQMGGEWVVHDILHTFV